MFGAVCRSDQRNLAGRDRLGVAEDGPCIRKNCPACAAGKGHSSYALYVRRGSRRFSIYVPQRLVPDVHRAIENGRLLQELINEAGVRYVSALKNEEPPTP